MSHPSHDATPSPYSAQEVAEFQAQDRSAAKAVVGLMMGVFLIGVALYLGVIYFIKAG